jgi:cytochrome c peroxidase
MGTVVRASEIGTDRYRLDSYTAAFAANQYGLFPESPYRFKRFRKTDGYANHPLDGIWARAPYLHNGSVPTLRDLLNAPEQRPTSFFRGYDVFDRARVGFVTDVAEEDGRRFFRYDTAIPGNSNAGHLYGVSLSDEDKQAIVEYLKTF